MARLNQIVLIVSTLALSWLGMMAVHELGHVAAAVVTGGKIARVVLHPLAFSRTDLATNPHPLIVGWGGGVIGALLPLLIFGAVSAARWRSSYLFRFFAGFCLVANGAYLGAGSWDGIGDAGDLLAAGAPRWMLMSLGVLAVIAGHWLWNGLGRSFGLRTDGANIDRATAVGTAAFLVVVIAVELILCPS
jgi:hypothetical protein